MANDDLTPFSVEDVGVGPDGRISFVDPRLAERFETAADRKRRPKPKPVPPNTNCAVCNTVAGCGPTNTTCTPINTVKDCGSKVRQ